MRFAFGLIASAAALPIVGDKAFASGHDSFYIALLAVVTGFLALGLYYYGLQRTPALLAALGELAFPVTAALVGIYVFNSNLRWTQWIGVAITVAVVTLLPCAAARGRARCPRSHPRPPRANLAAWIFATRRTRPHFAPSCAPGSTRTCPRSAAAAAAAAQRFDDAFGREWSRLLYEGGYAGPDLAEGVRRRRRAVQLPGDLLRGDGARATRRATSA